jgi:hypothetical protein
MRVIAMCLALPLAGSAAGCGDDQKTPDPTSPRLTAGSAPSARACGFDGPSSAPAAGRPASSPPRAGAYRYTTRGTGTVPGAGRERRLPGTTIARVSPVSREPGLACFTVERRYSPDATTQNVIVLRGEDVYITGLGFETPSSVRSVLPRPAVLALSGNQTAWSGTFRGSTSGSYEVEIVGRRRFDVGGRSVEAVGLESRASYTGELEGSQRATTWFATGRSALVVEESGETTVNFGGDRERLRFRSHLESLDPS